MESIETASLAVGKTAHVVALECYESIGPLSPRGEKQRKGSTDPAGTAAGSEDKSDVGAPAHSTH